MKDEVKYLDMSESDLNSRLVAVADELFSAKQKLRVGQFKKTSDFPRLRKEIARIKTILRARELAKLTERKSA